MESFFIPVPQTTLPGSLVVPAFSVAKYLMSQGEDGKPVSVAHAAPWVNINYFDAIQANTEAGLQLLRESQALAIAWDVSQQDINWTGGKVGEGKLFQGLHQWNMDSAQPATYESKESEERRWLQLSNGERIYDLAGNAFSWIFDDIQGDERGLVAKPFAEDSPSIATAPYPSREKGVGWRPSAGADWSGDALVRGGCWNSESYAGAFCLGNDWPDDARGDVGFRSTKPGL